MHEIRWLIERRKVKSIVAKDTWIIKNSTIEVDFLHQIIIAKITGEAEK